MLSTHDLISIACFIDSNTSAIIEEVKFAMFYKDNKFILETDKISPNLKHLSRSYELLKIIIGGKTYFGHDALNIRYPNSKYIFSRIASTESLSQYDTAIFNFNIDNSVELHNENFTIENNIVVNVKHAIIDDKNYAEIKTSERVSADRLIGLTLRYRHGLAFIFTNIESSSFVIISNSNDEFLITHGANVSIKHSYSVFFKPYEWDYTYKIENRIPHITNEFFKNFIETVLINTALYNVILLLCEKSSYNVYASTSISFVALEMLSTNFAIIENIPVSRRSEIALVKKQFIKCAKCKFDDGIITFETHSHISKKLNSLMQPTNADKLKILLEKYNLPISEQDKNILRLRNKYLHGAISDNLEKEMNDYRTYLSALRIASTLILKICEYSGPICSFDKLIANPSEKPSLEEAFPII